MWRITLHIRSVEAGYIILILDTVEVKWIMWRFKQSSTTTRRFIATRSLGDISPESNGGCSGAIIIIKHPNKRRCSTVTFRRTRGEKTVPAAQLLLPVSTEHVLTVRHQRLKLDSILSLKPTKFHLTREALSSSSSRSTADETCTCAD